MYRFDTIGKTFLWRSEFLDATSYHHQQQINTLDRSQLLSSRQGQFNYISWLKFIIIGKHLNRTEEVIADVNTYFAKLPKKNFKNSRELLVTFHIEYFPNMFMCSTICVKRVGLNCSCAFWWLCLATIVYLPEKVHWFISQLVIYTFRNKISEKLFIIQCGISKILYKTNLYEFSVWLGVWKRHLPNTGTGCLEYRRTNRSVYFW